MSFDTGGYRQRWTVPCCDLMGQDRRVLIAPTDDRCALLLAIPADTVRLTDEQAMEMAADLLNALLRTLPDE